MTDIPTWTLFIPGVPAPQGSKRHLGGGVMVESSKRVRPWRTDIREAAIGLRDMRAADGLPPSILSGQAVDVTLIFYMPRPKSHYRTGRRAHELRPDAPTWHTSRPDVDKLTRAVLDALSGVWWVDDSQVAMVTASKAYSDDGAPGVHIIAEVLP